MKKLLRSVWNRVRGIFEWMFECHHNDLSRVFTINHRSYKVCFECGQQVDYSLKLMHSLPHRTAARKNRATWVKVIPIQHSQAR